MKQQSFLFITVLSVIYLNIKSMHLVQLDKEYAATSKAFFLLLFFHLYN
jgi:hypothetical protein